MSDQTDAVRAALYGALGDYLDRNRREGIFALHELGPASVPELAALARPEYHLDLLPLVTTPEQREAVAALGCVWENERHAWHPDGWQLVLADITTSEILDHVALRDWLRQDEKARAAYRHSLETHGRALADEEFLAQARSWNIGQVGLLPVQQVRAALADLPAAWMVSSGWALDLFLAGPTRLHEDMDVVLPRERQMDVRQALLDQGWRLDACVRGAYQAWDAPLQKGDHQVHARHPDFSAHMLDLLFTDMDVGTWRYRRDPNITLPVGRARRFTADGTPYLAPEIVLLFKSSSQGGDPRSKDEADFRRALPRLDEQGKRWLAGVLPAGHRWREELEA